jgi:hypothetical protein
LTVAGASSLAVATLSGALGVSGKSTLMDASVGGGLNVTGDTKLSSALTVTGNTSLSGSLSVSGSVSTSTTTLASAALGVTVPDGVTVVIISSGSAVANYPLSLPSSPANGRLLFVRNQASYEAQCLNASCDVGIPGGTGALYVGAGGSWTRLL